MLTPRKRRRLGGQSPPTDDIKKKRRTEKDKLNLDGWSRERKKRC